MAECMRDTVGNLHARLEVTRFFAISLTRPVYVHTDMVSELVLLAKWLVSTSDF